MKKVKKMFFGFSFAIMVFGGILFYSTQAKATTQIVSCTNDARYWDDDRCPAAKDHCCGK